MHLDEGCFSLHLRMIWSIPLWHLTPDACNLTRWCVMHNAHCMRGLVHGCVSACQVLAKNALTRPRAREARIIDDGAQKYSAQSR